MKVIRIFNVQPVKIPQFKSPLTGKQARWPLFYCISVMFISWMSITPSFKQSLIVEQFQGNYLKRSTGTAAEMPPYEINKDSSSPLKKTKKHVGWSILRKSSTEQLAPEEELDIARSWGGPKCWHQTTKKEQISAFIYSIKIHKAPGKDRLNAELFKTDVVTTVSI